MIRGYFLPTGSEASPPYVDGLIDIPEIGVVGLEARFLIDTGADRSLLGDDDAGRMLRDYEVDLGRLEDGIPSQGIGGVVATREVQATLGLGDFSTSIRVGEYGIDLAQLRAGRQIRGIGGMTRTRVAQAVLEFGGFSTDLQIAMLEPTPGQPIGIPSLLGRDVLSHFALFMEERTDRVLLLEPDEADTLEFE